MTYGLQKQESYLTINIFEMRTRKKKLFFVSGGTQC